MECQVKTGRNNNLARTKEMRSGVSEVYARSGETNEDNRENPLGETQYVSQRRCRAVRERESDVRSRRRVRDG
jgi:hypothetical protein